jgi:hypothetical protein
MTSESSSLLCLQAVRPNPAAALKRATPDMNGRLSGLIFMTVSFAAKAGHPMHTARIQQELFQSQEKHQITDLIHKSPRSSVKKK